MTKLVLKNFINMEEITQKEVEYYYLVDSVDREYQLIFKNEVIVILIRLLPKNLGSEYLIKDHTFTLPVEAFADSLKNGTFKKTQKKGNHENN